MTGIAIVMYLNQTPFEPRERDYAYAGSFMPFPFGWGWGSGHWFILAQVFEKYDSCGIACHNSLCFVPIRMAAQNWDDHDRSERYMARDTGMNYLNSVGKTALFLQWR